MYNLLGTLLIVTAAVTGMRQGFVPNQLYHLGLLVLFGYLAGIAAERVRLPAVLGWIAAGVIAGPGCTALIGESFLDNMAFVSAFLVMLLLTETAAGMCRTTPGGAVRFLLTGAAASVLLTGITVLILTPLQVTPAWRLGLGLFAAAFSPLIMDALYGGRADARHHLIAVGGLFMTVSMWGFAVAYLGPANPDRLRIAFMPAFVALTSLVSGYALGLAAYVLGNGISLRRNRLYTAAVLFITYPLIGRFGLDYLFLAIGYGVFAGIARESEPDETPMPPVVTITVFALFGLSLALDSMVEMDAVEWKLAALLSAAVIGGRGLIFPAVSLSLKKRGGLPMPAAPLIPIGPVALILALRFLPGLRESSGDNGEQFALLRICTASIFIVLIITAIQTWTSRAIEFRNKRRPSRENK